MSNAKQNGAAAVEAQIETPCDQTFDSGNAWRTQRQPLLRRTMESLARPVGDLRVIVRQDQSEAC